MFDTYTTLNHIDTIVGDRDIESFMSAGKPTWSNLRRSQGVCAVGPKGGGMLKVPWGIGAVLRLLFSEKSLFVCHEFLGHCWDDHE